MKNIKLRRIILLSALCLAVTSTVIAAWSGLSRPAVQTGQPVLSPIPDYKYLVGSHNGYVAVYVAGEEAPSYITETPVSTLPARDRELLEAGIAIYSEEELTAILEDYES